MQATVGAHGRAPLRRPIVHGHAHEVPGGPNVPSPSPPGRRGTRGSEGEVVSPTFTRYARPHILEYVDETVIYHILPRADWDAAQRAGLYEPARLASEGFVHASTLAQVLPSAQHYYAGQDDLLLLCIDKGRLRCELRYEDLSGTGAHPHIYGPVELDCVARVLPLSLRSDGSFMLPAALEELPKGAAPASEGANSA
jgi:uncharacterized protein (DUF952 family)